MSALFFFSRAVSTFSGAPESHSPSGRQWPEGEAEGSRRFEGFWFESQLDVSQQGRRMETRRLLSAVPSSPFLDVPLSKAPLLLQQTVLKNVFALGSSHWQIPDKLWEKPNKWVETCNKCFLTGHGLHWMDWYVKKIENNLNKMLSLHSPELNPSDLQWEWGVRWCSPQQTREYLF